MRDAITITEAAELAGVHYETIRRWIDRDYLQAWKVGGQYRLAREDVVALLRGEAPHASASLPRSLGMSGLRENA